MKMKKKSCMKITVVAVTHKPKENRILHIDYPHGEFEADKNEMLMDFIKRINMPTD